MVDEGGLNAIGGEMGKFKYQGKSERALAIEKLEQEYQEEMKRKREKEREERKRNQGKSVKK